MSDHLGRKLPDGEELVWTDPIESLSTEDPHSSACERRRRALAKESIEHPGRDRAPEHGVEK
jgi:hypothetical protein